MAIALSGNLQWSLRVAAVLFLGVSWGTLVWVGCFYKVLGHRVSNYIKEVLLCFFFLGISYYL